MISKGRMDGTAPQSAHTHNHPYISSCKVQLDEISTAATCVGMVMWELCCVITATLYVHFIDQCHPFDFSEIIFIVLVYK